MRMAAITMAALALGACAGERQGRREDRAQTLTETGVLSQGEGQGTWELNPVGTTPFPLEIDEGTAVVEDGAPVGTGGLQPGDSVRVTYELAPGAEEARAVRVEVLPGEDVSPLGPAPEPGLDVLEPEAGAAGTGPTGPR